MKGRLLPMLVMIFAVSGLLVSAVPADGSDAAASDEEVYVSGLICEIGQTGPTPAKDVSVTLTYNGNTFSGKTGSDGTFKIAICKSTELDTSKKVYFDFTLRGFSVFTLPDTMTALEPNSGSAETTTADAIIDLEKITPVDGIYSATSDTQHCILIGDTYVPATFTVTNASTGVAVRNADVTLTNIDTGTTSRGTSDYDGVCKFSSGILIGSYDLVIKCDGYTTYKDTIEIKKQAAFTMSCEMNQKEPATYLGLTLYHLLMIIGVTVGLCLVVISYVLCKRTWRNVDKSDVENN